MLPLPLPLPLLLTLRLGPLFMQAPEVPSVPHEACEQGGMGEWEWERPRAEAGTGPCGGAGLCGEGAGAANAVHRILPNPAVEEERPCA